MKSNVAGSASGATDAAVLARAGDRAAANETRALRRRHRSLWSDALVRFRQHRLATVGVFIFLTLLVATLVGPLFYHVSTEDVDFSASMSLPSLAHPFGTDDLGHDVLARVLWADGFPSRSASPRWRSASP